MTPQVPLTPAALTDALAQEIATAIAGLLGEKAAVSRTERMPQAAWVASVEASGALAGSIVVGFSEPDGRAVSGLILGLEGDVPDESVTDTLREVCGQAIGALAGRPETSGVALALGSVGRGELPGPQGAVQFGLPGGLAPTLIIRTNLEVMPEEKAAPGPPAVGPVAVAPRVSSPPPANLDVVLDIELPLAVRFGSAELTIGTLSRLGPGSVIDLHRSPDEPVEILVSGKVIARGEVVVVDGNYGVRVVEILSTTDRIRSMGA